MNNAGILKVVFLLGLIALVFSEESKKIRDKNAESKDNKQKKRGLNFGFGDHIGFGGFGEFAGHEFGGGIGFGIGDFGHHAHVDHVITKHVPVPAPYPVHVPIKVPVDRPYPVPAPYPVHVEKHVPYPVKVPVEVPVKVPVEVPVEVPVKVPVVIKEPYPVFFNDHHHDIGAFGGFGGLGGHGFGGHGFGGHGGIGPLGHH